MKRSRPTQLALTLLAVIATPVLAEPATVSLSGQVRGAAGKYSVYVALWNEEGFLQKPLERVKFKPGEAPAFHFDVKPGRYALSAFEDRNENGVLDRGMFGPKEPNGFFKPFSGWHKPTFPEVAFAIDTPLLGADIELK
jgi:uncharacterized protein (DUF2141 family)